MDPPIDTNLIEFDTKWVSEDSFSFFKPLLIFVNKVLAACEWNICLSWPLTWNGRSASWTNPTSRSSAASPRTTISCLRTLRACGSKASWMTKTRTARRSPTPSTRSLWTPTHTHTHTDFTFHSLLEGMMDGCYGRRRRRAITGVLPLYWSHPSATIISICRLRFVSAAVWNDAEQLWEFRCWGGGL